MADKAFMVLDDGRMIEVYAKDLGEADRNKKYLCCGKPRGVPCLTELSLVILANGDNYFAARSGRGHRRFCCYDNSSEFGRITHVDPTGTGDSPQTIMQRFNRVEGPAHGNGRDAGNAGGHVGEVEAEEKEDIVEVARVPGRPRNLKELVLTLISLADDDYYAGVRVQDFLIDHRSIRNYRDNGLDDGTIAIVIASKTTKGRAFRNGDSSMVLADAFYFDQKAEEELLFVVNASALECLKKIWEASRHEKIAVLARWHRHPEKSNVYISEVVGSRCIAVIDREHFEE